MHNLGNTRCYDAHMKRRALLAAILLLSVIPVFPALPVIPVNMASAHTTLESATPAVSSIIQSWPQALTLTFGEPLELIKGQKLNFVTVHGADGSDLGSGLPMVESTKITVPVKVNKVPGVVLVNYRVVAADGHVLNGEYTFNFQSASANNQPKQHHGDKNTAVYSATTVLIVLSLLAGVWIYRRRKA